MRNPLKELSPDGVPWSDVLWTFLKAFAFAFVIGGWFMLTVALSSCATPAVHDRIVEVDKPVAVQPITPAQVPAPPAPLGPRPPSLSAAADLLLSRWCSAVGYMLKADPLLRLSAGMPQQALAKYPECE